jgi:hypothetical protein
MPVSTCALLECGHLVIMYGRRWFGSARRPGYRMRLRNFAADLRTLMDVEVGPACRSLR